MQMGIFKTAIGGRRIGRVRVNFSGTALANGSYTNKKSPDTFPTGLQNGKPVYFKDGVPDGDAYIAFDGAKWNLIAGATGVYANASVNVDSNTWFIPVSGYIGVLPAPKITLG